MRILSDLPSAEESLSLYFQLFNEIGIINQLASSAFEKVLPSDLTVAQFSVLNHCTRLGDNRTPASLASAFQVTKGTMTSTLTRLEAKAFIRIEPDEKDKRSKRVFLTDSGRAARDESIANLAPVLQKASTSIALDDVLRILPTLKELRIWLDENR